MKNNTFEYIDIQINDDEYLSIVKSKLDKRYHEISGYLYEVDVCLNNDIVIFSRQWEGPDAYKEMKKYLKETHNINFKQEYFKLYEINKHGLKLKKGKVK